MPGYIAWLYVYGQATKMAQADGVFNRWNEEGFKKSYYEKFFVGADSLVQVIEPVEPEIQTFEEDPAPGTGVSYTPEHEKAKRGRPTKV